MSSPNVETNPPSSLLGTLLVRADESRTFSRGAHSLVILLDGKQTDEKLTALLSNCPPGGGLGPHYHEREDETSFRVRADGVGLPARFDNLPVSEEFDATYRTNKSELQDA